MLRTSRRGIALASSALLAVVGMGALTACSSSSSEPTASPTASESATETGTSVLPPVIVEPDQTEATAKVGNTIVFNVADPTKEAIATSDATILEVVPGKDDGSAVFNPGAVALAAGTATVTLTNADTGAETIITVTVTE